VSCIKPIVLNPCIDASFQILLFADAMDYGRAGWVLTANERRFDSALHFSSALILWGELRIVKDGSPFAGKGSAEYITGAKYVRGSQHQPKQGE
jgi:hypothetical protein